MIQHSTYVGNVEVIVTDSCVRLHNKRTGECKDITERFRGRAIDKSLLRDVEITAEREFFSHNTLHHFLKQ
jgi:hypothetical protein